MRPTSVRIFIAALLTIVACLLYLDRFAMGIASEAIRVDLKITQEQMSWVLSAFFISYALCQVPAGWLSDRFGPRLMLTVYILGWSLFTGLLGLTTHVGIVLLLRLLCGAAQAGAYPVCSGMIRKWFHVSRRGTASSIVAMGGRSGGVLAPILTAALMAAFTGGWRPVLILYGLVGIMVAFIFAWLSRNSPSEHPLCNDAERSLISGDPLVVATSFPAGDAIGRSGADETKESDNPLFPLLNDEESRTPVTAAQMKKSDNPFAVIEADRSFAAINIKGADKTAESSDESQRFPLIPVLTSISLWGNSLAQFFTNIGWLFVVTWLPRYLGDVHQVPLKTQAWMTAIPTAAGIAGMFCGGWWTDAAARRFGLKWGRRLPVVATRFMAAAGYGLCLILSLSYLPDPASRWLPWAIVAGLSVATFSCDLGVPAIWAYSQDVGGKYTASIMGWSNMYGNFGAAIAPLLYNAILGETPTLSQWNSLFGFCSGVFALAGVSAMVLDSTKLITSERQHQI